MRNRVPMLALGAALTLPVVAQAGHHDDASVWEAPSRAARLDGSLVDVQIQVDGATSPLFFSPRWDDDRRYFEAFAGRNYAVVVQNNTGARVAVLMAVDGLNVVNGERTSLSASEPMYVLGPHERTTIRGWRTSLDHVRRFVFVDERRSYAERTGQANGDMGWIRVLSFREQPVWWDRRGRRRDEGSSSRPEPLGEDTERSERPPDAAAPSPGSSKPSPSTLEGEPGVPATPPSYARGNEPSYPGTGWGDRHYDPVRETSFTPDGPAVDRMTLRYEYASGLLALGIDPRHERTRERWRERDSEFGFAQPPPR